MDHTTSTLPERPLRALVLDDDEAALNDLRRSLEARHYGVLAAADGASGLDLLLEELLGLDVLVTDLDLPHRNARSFADLIRRAGGERDLVIVVLATDADPACHADLLAVGVDAILDRDAGAEALAATIDELVARRSSFRASEPRSPIDSGSPDPDARGSLAFRKVVARGGVRQGSRSHRAGSPVRITRVRAPGRRSSSPAPCPRPRRRTPSRRLPPGCRPSGPS